MRLDWISSTRLLGCASLLTLALATPTELRAQAGETVAVDLGGKLVLARRNAKGLWEVTGESTWGYEGPIVSPQTLERQNKIKAAPANSQPKALVMRAQLALAKLGYEVGTPDGIPGARTKAALKDYQQNHGLPVDDQFSETLVAQLEEATKPPAPVPDPPPIVPTPDTQGPTIATEERLDVAASKAVIAGKVIDASKIDRLTVDGEAVDVATDGSFSVTTGLLPIGQSEHRLMAADAAGNETSLAVTIVRKSGGGAGATVAKLDPAGIQAAPNPSAVALVIGVGEYKELPPVRWADQDAGVFYNYAQLALGVPEERIVFLPPDQTGLGGILQAIKTRVRPEIEPGQSDLYVFFAGHGLAEGEKRYLLPSDVRPVVLQQTAITRKVLEDELVDTGARTVTLFLDTCYTGETRDGQALCEGCRGAAVVEAAEAPATNVTVLAAASDKQVSSGWPAAGHGLFSYYLMRGLEGAADRHQGDGGGDSVITVGELYDYLAREVSRQAARQGREQTPTLSDGADRSRVLVRLGA